MDLITRAMPTQPTTTAVPAAARQTPQEDAGKPPVDVFTPSAPVPDPGIYKKQPGVSVSVRQKPDGNVDRKDGQLLPTGARGELGTEAKATATTTVAPGVTSKTTASGTLHADGAKQGGVGTEVRAEQEQGEVKAHASVSGEVSASTKPEQPSTYDAKATATAGLDAKKGDDGVGVSFNATASQGTKGSAASIGLGVNGQTRLGPVSLRGEAGLRGAEKDGGALHPEIFGKIQVGNPKLPVSVQAQCSGDPTTGGPTCSAGLGGRF